MHIANPLYDAAFKYLLEDVASAKVLLSALLDEEIVDLMPLAREHAVTLETLSLTVYRMDFSARIRTQEGRFKQVILEVQKAKMGTDIMRFRRYLGAQYSNPALVYEDEAGDSHPLPIMSLYFLGYKLKHLHCSVVRVGRQCYDAVTSSPLKNSEEAFIESLTHDSLVVQVSLLEAPYRGELERLLSIFDQHLVTENGHVLVVDEQTMPGEGKVLLRRLNRAVMEPEVREKMEAEDDFLEALEVLERKTEDQKELLEEKDKALEEKDKVVQEQGKALEEKDKVLEENQKALMEQARLIQELKRRLGPDS